MLERVKEVFLQSGYMRIAISEPQVEVLYKLVQGGLYFVCLVDDTEGWLVAERPAKMMDFLANMLTEKYSAYTQGAEGIMVVFTTTPKQTLEKLGGGFNYWLANPVARKLMIYEDQPDNFYDVRGVLEKYLQAVGAGSILGQLKVLLSPVNISLIAVNIIVFIVLSVIGSTNDIPFMFDCGAFTAHSVADDGQYYRLFTAMFLHFGGAHLIYNMISLLYLGRALEGTVGSIRYLILYVTSGLFAGGTSVFIHYYSSDAMTVCAGASGAICGVAGALAFYMIRDRKKHKGFSFIRWAIFVALVAAQGFGNSGIDNAAHVGGVVFGLLLGMLISLIPYKGKEGGPYVFG